MFEAVLKNPHSHSAAGEESHIFLFKSKNQKMRSFGFTSSG
ncbi:hypothetical protein SULYE_1430 [Sulfurihydrogenibium yellowstonense SS-5]|uniref:Uncharacterized protein n=1 Tax=Sulfurihydrogenibium yellowstonense SS-5 TaxID=432331 RepID=C4FLH6_9AQUI|nr:hypothetical protein SULYE_1430 [Sulfurihydrogenibium yellowstonense SS-5]